MAEFTGISVIFCQMTNKYVGLKNDDFTFSDIVLLYDGVMRLTVYEADDMIILRY